MKVKEEVKENISDLEKLVPAAIVEDDLNCEDVASEFEGVEGDEIEQQPEMETGALCASLLTISFALLASQRGAHWNLSEAEAVETGSALGVVLDKYFPDMKNQGAEVAALMTCVMVVTPRVMMDKKLSQSQEKEVSETAPDVKEKEEVGAGLGGENGD